MSTLWPGTAAGAPPRGSPPPPRGSLPVPDCGPLPPQNLLHLLIRSRAKGQVLEFPATAAAMVELGAGILEVVVEPVPPLKTEATAAGRRPRRARTAAAIQRVFQACGAVFAAPGTVHAPVQVALLRAMLNTDEARRQFNEVNKLVLRSMRAKSLIGLIRIRVTAALHYRSEQLLVCLSDSSSLIQACKEMPFLPELIDCISPGLAIPLPDHELLVANGTYALTAGNCVWAGQSRLHCQDHAQEALSLKILQWQQGTMDSKVRHNRADDNKYVHHARQEMDKNMQREREVMDENVKHERATVDRMRKEERAAVEQMMTEERAAVDQRLKHFHDDMDHKLQQERKDMDRTIQLERGRMEFNIMQARANMDRKLHQERNDMDHKAKMEQIRMEGNMMQDRAVQLERGKMDVNNMQTRADMDLKLQQDRNDLDYKAKMEQVRMEGNMMQDRASTRMKAQQAQRDIPTLEQSVSTPPPEAQRDIPPPKQSVSSPPPRVVVMEFNVYVEYELSHIPQAYLNDRPGTMTFVEPYKVEWWRMADVLSTFGYKGNADVYYIKPGCIPPEGMVEILGQDDVDKMMHDHEGIKKCDLYVVKNYPCSDDDMNGQDMYEQDMDSCEFLDRGDDDMNKQDMYEENRDPCELPDRAERDSDEDGSSPRKKKRGLNNPKKSLDFGSSDEPLQ